MENSMRIGLIRQRVRKLDQQLEKPQPNQQQISNFLNEHYNISTTKLSATPASSQQILQILSAYMAQLNLPTLSLFHKTSSTSRRHSPAKPYGSPLQDILRQTSRIDQQIYAPYLPYRPTIYDQEYQQALEVRQAVKLQYLTAYNEAIRKQTSSFGSTQRVNSPAAPSFRKLQPCYCEETHIEAPQLKPIVKTPYLSQQQYVPAAIPQDRQKIEQRMPSKQAYLGAKSQEIRLKSAFREEQPDVSIIQRINKSLLETEKNHNQGNLSKMINDSNVMRTNQSLIIEVSQPPHRETIKQVSEQVQTEETGNKSFTFIEARRQKMDQANFHKTIQQLNHQINHLSLELSSEDVVIDLTDLVNTKDEYFEESKEILNSLQALSDERASNSILVKSKRHGDMIWPQF